MKLLVCHHLRSDNQPSCAENNGPGMCDALLARLAQQGYDVEVEAVGCLGRCDEGPIMRIAPGGPFFEQVREATLDEVCQTITRWIDSEEL